MRRAVLVVSFAVSVLLRYVIERYRNMMKFEGEDEEDIDGD